MYKDLIMKVSNLRKKPKIFEQSTAPFWDDKHISKMMLEAHLDTEWDAATRNMKTVIETVHWIQMIAPKKTHKRMLDLGCGPGIYTSYFCQDGYDVTGVDISERSIAYAKEQAIEKNLQIHYVHQDYTTLETLGTFDIITLIYFDYAVMSKQNRMKVLNFVKNSLSENGFFILDIFTPNFDIDRNDKNSVSVEESAGFFKDQAHIVFSNTYFYDGNIKLEQYVVIDEFDVQAYRVWYQQFTLEEITSELEEAGLRVKMAFSDLTGKPYLNDSKTIGLVVSNNK